MSTTKARYSDEWWFDRLLTKFDEKPKRPKANLGDSRKYDYKRTEWLEYLWAYHTGCPPLAQRSANWGDATKEFLRLSKNNFGGLLTTALLNRVQFQGVRKVGTQDPAGDADVRRFLSGNGSFFDDAEEFAGALGEGYILVGPSAEEGGVALATAEDPRSMVVITSPRNPYQVLAGLKMYYDDLDETFVAAVYIAADKLNGIDTDHLVTYTAEGRAGDAPPMSLDKWKVDSERSFDLDVQGLGVPIVPLTSPKRIGQLEPHLDLLDRITEGISDRLWALKYQVFMQRAIRSDDLPDIDPETGKYVNYDEIFAADPGAMWKLPKDADIWESKQINVQEVLAPVRDDLRELSAVSGIPLPVLLAESANGSAEGATVTRESVSFLAEDRIRRWSPSAVRVAKLGLAYSGKPFDGEYEAVWGPVERLSLGQKMAAGRDAVQASVPVKAIWGDVMQMPPETVARWSDERDEELLFSDLTTVTPQRALPPQPTDQNTPDLNAVGPTATSDAMAPIDTGAVPQNGDKPWQTTQLA